MGFRSKKEKINGKAFIMIALLVFLVSDVWAACETKNSDFWGCPVYCSNYSNCSCTLNAKPAATHTGSCSFVNYGTVNNVTIRFIYNGEGNLYCDAPSNYGCSKASDYQAFFGAVITCCASQCEADSLQCVNAGKEWTTIPGGSCDGKGCLEHCDSTYHCESVFTDNNVLRSSITLTDCHGDILQERQVLGSCNQNGFCNGDQVSGIDSCSYPTPDPNKCKSGGQNGSLCTYLCPDGNLYSCRIAWEPGQPSEYQPCPSKPPSNCNAPYAVSSSSAMPNPDGSSSSTEPGASSSSVTPDPDCPECDYLQEIRDTLHRANEQRKYQNYVIDEIKEDVGGFGAQFNAIISNTSITANRINSANGNLSVIASTNSQIADKLNNLDLDNITATVDSIVVHVETENPDSVNFAPWRDLDSLPVWRDTLSMLQGTLNDINGQIDTLVQDSNGVNALKKYLPYIKKIYDDASNFYSGFTLPAVFDTLSSRLGLDTVTVSEAQDIEDKIIPLGDSAYIDGNFYCEEHPDAAVCVELDSSELAALVGPDTVDANEFFRVQDSILEANRAYLDSLKKRDSIQDTLGLDELAGDSAKIREKLDFLFLPENTLEQCFDFRLNTTLGKWTYNLFIDFADLFGLDLCDLIRKIVRILTFILIVFTTIKGYIRAFGGGGSGGDV